MAYANKRLISVQWGQALLGPVNIDLPPSLFCLKYACFEPRAMLGWFLFEDVILIDS